MSYRTTKIYQNIVSGSILDAAGNPLENTAQPFIRLGETAVYDIQYLNSDTVSDVYTGLAGTAISATASVDNDWIHFFDGKLTAAASGAITQLAVGYSGDGYINPTGQLQLENAAGDQETVEYTAFTVSNGNYTFAVAATLANSYASGATCRIAQTPLIAAASVDITHKDTGRLLVTLCADNKRYVNALNNTKEITACALSVQIYGAAADGETAPLILAQEFDFRCLNLRNYNRIAPAPINNNYLTSAQILALLRTAPEQRYSADGTTWHGEQAASDRFKQSRYPNGEWGAAFEIIPRDFAGLNAKTALVDADVVVGNDSAASNGLIVITLLKVWNYIKGKADSVYAAIPHAHAIADVTNLQTSLDAKADLVSGKVPAAQLPSFVDDVIEAYIVGGTAFAAGWLSLTEGGAALTPESGKIYIILTAGTYNLREYRWSGSVYAQVNEGLAIGETSSTAYRGDYGKIAYDHSQLTSGNPHNTPITAIIGAGTAAALNAGTSANNVVQLDSNGKLPAIDGSQLIDVTASGNAVSLQGKAVSAVAPANGQQLVWNATTQQYEPSTPAGGGDVVGPASSTNGTIVLFDGTTGKALKDSNVKLSDKAASGANSDITSLTGLATALSVTQGGTGAINAADARTNLGAAPAVESINAQTGTSYTLALTDANGLITMANSAANTTIIPLNSTVAFAVGAWIDVQMTGAGITTIAGATGVTVNGTSAGTVALSANQRVRLIKTAADEWRIGLPGSASSGSSSGGSDGSAVSLTADYTMTTADIGKKLTYTSSTTASRTVTLCTAPVNNSARTWVINNSSYDIVVSNVRNSSSSTGTLTLTPGTSFLLESSGADWFVRMERWEPQSASYTHTFAGLNGNVDKRYKLISSIIPSVTTAGSVVAQINGDSNASNYICRWLGYESSTVASGQSTPVGIYIDYLDTYTTSDYVELKMDAVSGKFRHASSVSSKYETNMSTSFFYNNNMTWKNSADNITSIVLTTTGTTSTTLAGGSCVELWKTGDQT